MTHFVEKCECGRVLRQCRCPSRDKAERVVGPCAHDSETGDLDGDKTAVEPERGA